MNKKTSEYDQLDVEEGIERFGEGAVTAVFQEFHQLADVSTFKPMDPSKVTRTEKRKALNLITKVKKKRCGKIKGRACADGRKQRRYLKKEDITSPAIQLESFIMLLLINAIEGRDIATADIAGAFLKAFMKDFVLIRIAGESVDILCRVNPEYENYVCQERRRKVKIQATE